MKKIVLSLLVASVGLMAADGAALYKKCAACHGAKGEKAALGKSAVIGGVAVDTLVADMKGYKDGTVNKKGMGALMKGQVAAYDDAQIQAVAEYIHGL